MVQRRRAGEGGRHGERPTRDSAVEGSPSAAAPVPAAAVEPPSPNPELSAIRDVVSERDRAALLERLESARVARRNLPTTIPSTEAMSEMRIPVLDRPGVMAEISGVLGRHGISIASLIQHETATQGPVSLVIMTHRCEAAAIARAVTALDQQPAVQAATSCLPVLDD